jgi:transcriptional regulator with XRE-family HTH domain
MNSEYYDHNLASRLIERYCEEHGIKESEYADLLDVHPGSLSRIKAGKMASPQVLAKIAALGKVSVRDLINEAPESAKAELFTAGRKKSLPVCV